MQKTIKNLFLATLLISAATCSAASSQMLCASADAAPKAYVADAIVMNVFSSWLAPKTMLFDIVGKNLMLFWSKNDVHGHLAYVGLVDHESGGRGISIYAQATESKEDVDNLRFRALKSIARDHIRTIINSKMPALLRSALCHVKAGEHLIFVEELFAFFEQSVMTELEVDISAEVCVGLLAQNVQLQVTVFSLIEQLLLQVVGLAAIARNMGVGGDEAVVASIDALIEEKAYEYSVRLSGVIGVDAPEKLVKQAGVLKDHQELMPAPSAIKNLASNLHNDSDDSLATTAESEGSVICAEVAPSKKRVRFVVDAQSYLASLSEVSLKIEKALQRRNNLIAKSGDDFDFSLIDYTGFLSNALSSKKKR